MVELIFFLSLSILLLFVLMLESTLPGQLYASYLISIIYKPFLLQAYYRARSAYPEPPKDSFCIITECCPMLIKNVACNQSPSPPETRLAMHGKAISA